MCQPVVKFCTGSTKPLLFSGSLFTLILAIVSAALAWSYHSLYQQIDPTAAQGLSEYFYLQLLAAAYLILVTVFGSFAAYYDQKHFIRALAVITTVNLALATVAILFVPNGAELSGRFEKRLDDARGVYNYTAPPAANPNSNASTDDKSSMGAGVTPMMRKRRLANDVQNKTSSTQSLSQDGAAASTGDQPKKLTDEDATRIWDLLQSQGCCGFKRAEEWKPLPKSCCANATSTDKGYTCASPDPKHRQSCAEVLGAASYNLMILLALIALVNLFLATVAGVSTYRTFHYNEASQNAYN